MSGSLRYARLNFSTKDQSFNDFYGFLESLVKIDRARKRNPEITLVNPSGKKLKERILEKNKKLNIVNIHETFEEFARTL